MKARVEVRLKDEGVIAAIEREQRRENVTTAELGIPQVFHFIYAGKAVGLNQCLSVAFSLPYISEPSQQRLLRRYQHVYHMAHGKVFRGAVDSHYGKNNIVVDNTPTETVVGFIGDESEVYFAVSPLADMKLIRSCLDRILKAVQRNSSSLFFMEKNTWK